jgi:hypothetical protein
MLPSAKQFFDMYQPKNEEDVIETLTLFRATALQKILDTIAKGTRNRRTYKMWEKQIIEMCKENI